MPRSKHALRSRNAGAPVLVSLSFAHPHVSASDRDALAIPESQLVKALTSLDRRPEELAVISTCLRYELVAVGSDLDTLSEVARETSGVETLPEPADYRYGREVAKHLFRVAAGLCSPVVGEPEVLGQVRRAHAAGREAGTIGPVLDQLFREAIRTAREAHDALPDVDHGSIATIAADLLRDSPAERLVLVGAGTMANAVHAGIAGTGWDVVRITRRPERLGPEALGFHALEEEILVADAVVSAVTSPQPLFDAALLRRVGAARRNPLLVVDLGVPANFDRSVLPSLPGIRYVGMDDLARDERHRIVTDEAEALIDVRAWEVHARILNSTLTPLIKALRVKAEQAADEELTRAFGRLRDLRPEQRAVIEQMARTLSNRLLHDPLAYLSSHPEAVATSTTARRILGIEPTEA